MTGKAMLVTLVCCIVSILGYGQPDRFFAPDILYVKMKDDAGYAVQEQQLISLRKEQEEILKALAQLGTWVRGHDVSNEKLEQWRREAQQNLKQQLPDLRMEFSFRLRQPGNRDKAQKLLLQLADVQQVRRVPLPGLPLPADFSGQQLYVPDIATGIGADSVHLVFGNKGGGIKFCDLEIDFNPDHADLPDITLLGIPNRPFGESAANHGTAVLGEVVALDNGWGITGAAPDCKPYFTSIYTDDNFSIAAAITRAIDVLDAGDVLLVELHIPGPNTNDDSPIAQRGFVPVEWDEPAYNAIKLAVGKGIVVVEAAGNGYEDLDDPIYSTGNEGHYPFLPANNSGAILVGGGGVGARGAPRARLPYSNYGSRVDLQGNGERVTSTGYGDLYDAEGDNYAYTQVFSGTSSASPIVTAAAILLQATYKSLTHGALLSSTEINTLLKITGKPQVSNSAPILQQIGPLPNVYAAIKKALENTTGLPALFRKATAVVYPNPGAGKFSLFCPEGVQASTVQVSNISGHILRNYTLAKGPKFVLEMDLSNQPDGIYFVRLISAGSSQVQRIVLQH